MNVHTSNQSRQLESVTRFSVQHLNFLEMLKKSAKRKGMQPQERKIAEAHYLLELTNSFHAAQSVKAVQQLMPLCTDKKLSKQLRSKARALKQADAGIVSSRIIPVPQTTPAFAGASIDA